MKRRRDVAANQERGQRGSRPIDGSANKKRKFPKTRDEEKEKIRERHSKHYLLKTTEYFTSLIYVIACRARPKGKGKQRCKTTVGIWNVF